MKRPKEVSEAIAFDAQSRLLRGCPTPNTAQDALMTVCAYVESLEAELEGATNAALREAKADAWEEAAGMFAAAENQERNLDIHSGNGSLAREFAMEEASRWCFERAKALRAGAKGK